jgi:ElaB/YqjD/DUF883 family membrane-anchored ribosome-binding protein
LAQVDWDRLIADLKAVVHDAAMDGDIVHQVRDAAGCTDRCARGKPWLAIGAGVAAGLLVGMLVGRSRGDSR